MLVVFNMHAWPQTAREFLYDSVSPSIAVFFPKEDLLNYRHGVGKRVIFLCMGASSGDLCQDSFSKCLFKTFYPMLQPRLHSLARIHKLLRIAGAGADVAAPATATHIPLGTALLVPAGPENRLMVFSTATSMGHHDYFSAYKSAFSLLGCTMVHSGTDIYCSVPSPEEHPDACQALALAVQHAVNTLDPFRSLEGTWNLPPQEQQEQQTQEQNDERRLVIEPL